MGRLSYKEAKEIPIVDYLNRLGHEPAKIRGNDYWYYSPYREERTPSFKVNIKLNAWYDHGIGQGGNILDLGVKIHECNMQEFVNKLSEGNFNVSSFTSKPSKIEVPKSKIDIFSISEGFNPTLRQYLNMRGVDEPVARKYCKEVEFFMNNRMYTAIGFQNKSGAYELRNSWFKGSSAPKNISVILNKSDKLSVFEGFMDFLSVQQLNTFNEQTEYNQLTRDSNFLVLNSISLLNKNISVLQGHKENILFLDNDHAATIAKEDLRQKGIRFHDASHLFTSHKDVNEYLQAIRKIRQGEGQYRKRSKGHRL